MTLSGKTPNEIHHLVKFPARRKPRIEPHASYPRGSNGAKPQTLIAGKPGDGYTLKIQYDRSRKHLPIVNLKRRFQEKAK